MVADHGQQLRYKTFLKNKDFYSGELRLSRNHTVTEHEMSREPYSQKSGWIIHSMSEFAVHVMAKLNIAQCLIGDWECITVVDSEGVRTPPRY